MACRTALGLAFLLASCASDAWAQQASAPAYPVYRVTNSAPPAVTSPNPALAPAPASPAPPPSAAARLSAADLEKLVAPIALYPDSLIATILPASVYPLEIVQAARFVANTNNLAKLDEQPWDDNVRAVARIPAVIQKMNDDLTWTMALGEAFLAQDKDIMDAIQNLRGKAQKAGTLQTTAQQIVTVTNVIIEKTIEQQVVVVTNTIVQIQPSNPQVVYVPTYNPYTVYYPPPAYVYNPVAPLITFGAGIAVGAIIANNCDWYHGGCYHGSYHGNVNINVNNNYNRNVNVNNPRGPGNPGTLPANTQKWQPDQSRLNRSGSPGAANTARTADARGWGSNGARPSTGNAAARPSTGAVGARPSTGNVGTRPAAAPAANRPAPSASSWQSKPSPSASRTSSGNSAFGGVNNGSAARSYSNRGASSAGGFSGSRGGFSGGRGGGGRR